MVAHNSFSTAGILRSMGKFPAVLRKHWQISVACVVFLALLSSSIFWFGHIEQQKQEAREFLQTVTGLVVRYNALKNAVGEKISIVGENDTLFSRVEKIVSELGLKKRAQKLQTSNDTNTEQVHLIVKKLQTIEFVRLLFRVENTIGRVAVTQARIEKKENGIWAELIIQPQ